MHSLKSPLQQSYLDHPAFQFGSGSWKVKDQTLSAFNIAYSSSRSIGATSNAPGWAALRRECQLALQRIFAELGAQCTDEWEQSFVQELRRACVLTLDQELDWFHRPAQPDCARLARDDFRMCAVAMTSERYFMGRLQTDTVTELRSVAAIELDGFRRNIEAGRLTREDLSINSGPTVNTILKILNQAFAQLGVLDAVSAYSSRRMRVTGVALELSAPQATWWRNAIPGIERPAHTLYAHIDETIANPKSIVYLTDVTEDSGPTGCYPGAYESFALNPMQELLGRIVSTVGNDPASPLNAYYHKQYHQSVSSENFRRHYMRLPEVLRFNSHIGWDVMPGSALETALSSGEKKMLGPAGTFIAFDGARLFHRGGLMQQGERVALQVVFSDQFATFPQRVTRKLKGMLT